MAARKCSHDGCARSCDEVAAPYQLARAESWQSTHYTRSQAPSDGTITNATERCDEAEGAEEGVCPGLTRLRRFARGSKKGGWSARPLLVAVISLRRGDFLFHLRFPYIERATGHRLGGRTEKLQT